MTAPFENCRFRECDLPGQCRSEGKCHHPSVASAKGAKPVAWVRYRSDGGFEGPIMDTDARMCDTRRGFWTPLYAAPVADSAMAKDAERYRWLRHFTRGQQTFGGVSTGASPQLQWFEFPAVAPLGNIMRGAVSQHLDESIDAAIAASAEKGD